MFTTPLIRVFRRVAASLEALPDKIEGDRTPDETTHRTGNTKKVRITTEGKRDEKLRQTEELPKAYGSVRTIPTTPTDRNGNVNGGRSTYGTVRRWS